MSFASRLPPELWCIAWETMPFADRVTVSHVSRHWRNIAIFCPLLWTHLDFFSTVHSSECDCDFCLYEDPISGEFVHTLNDPPGGTNRRLIAHVTRRSGKLPLSLNMFVGPFSTDMGLLEDFATDLCETGAADRLVSLRIAFDDQDALRSFLYTLHSLPALRTIFTEALPLPLEFRRSSDGHPWRNNYIDLPALQHMVLDSMCWKIILLDDDPSPTTITLPSLQSLVCELTDPEEVRLALDACPALQSLTVRVPPYYPNDYDSDAEFAWRLDAATKRRLSEIRRVAVTAVITVVSERWAIENFGGPLQRDVVLHYDTAYIPLHGFAVSRQLGDIHTFAVSTTTTRDIGPSFVCTMVDHTGSRRRIVFSTIHWRACIPRFLAAARPFIASLQVLQLTAGLVTHFLSQATPLSSLHTLVIFLGRADDLLLIADRLTQSLSRAVPSLSAVQLSAAAGQTVQVPVDVVASLLVCVRGVGPKVLKTLILDGVVLAGDLVVLDRHVADTVVM
ncbi:hypothetical protein EXIGLDRAFT_746005 [Exidia glandulosa HHB12029]|uniref:F-box domain-containing protein n=1 Tax=Exidia glandulosa HHB12029 TaxID=1314781 RepID=A0A165MU03_EXIGL|nr:hypothetical protein EXIGLDRAFT_746005 [Exidia glandulosa HHB12029]